MNFNKTKTTMPEDLVCLSHLAVGIRVPAPSASPQSIREATACVFCGRAGADDRSATDGDSSLPGNRCVYLRAADRRTA